MKSKTKTNIFLDFDGTIVDSIKAYCDVYNDKYKHNSKFVAADSTKAYKWDMRDICPLEKEVSRVFDSPEFFNKLQFIDNNIPSYIRHLQYYYNIIICTIGSNYNIHYKSKWIAEKLPFITQAIYLVNTGNSGAIMDKSLPDMSNSILIDDNIKNLHTSNAKHKIIFGKEYEYNIDKNNQYIRVNGWKQLHQLLVRDVYEI